MDNTLKPVKEEVRFQISIPKGNELRFEKIVDKSAESLGYETYHIIEIRNVVYYPDTKRPTLGNDAQ